VVGTETYGCVEKLVLKIIYRPLGFFKKLNLMKYYRFLRLFFSLLWGANWYVGVDRPNVWQWLYGWRIGFRTAFEVSRKINL
jgi:hypothetical protein